MIHVRRDRDLVILRVHALTSATEAVRDDLKRRINGDLVVTLVSQTGVYFCDVYARQST